MSTRTEDRPTTQSPGQTSGRQLSQRAVLTSKELGKLARAKARSSARNKSGLIDQVKKGLPFHSVESLASDLGMSTNRLSNEFLDISRATLTRRRQSGQLRPDESDKVVRFTRLRQLAIDLMEGNEEAACRWLCAPLPVLGNESPLEYARTEIGAHELEQLIGRLEHGVFS